MCRPIRCSLVEDVFVGLFLLPGVECGVDALSEHGLDSVGGLGVVVFGVDGGHDGADGDCDDHVVAFFVGLPALSQVPPQVPFSLFWMPASRHCWMWGHCWQCWVA